MPPFNSQYSTGVSYTHVDITPSDAVNLVEPVRWVDVLTGGNISYVNGRGQQKTMTGVPAGYAMKCVVQRINATGTTASGFIGYP